MEENDWKREFIIEEIKKKFIDCPQCENATNEHYTCTMCHNVGGNGLINVYEFLKENKDILN